jgi:hypothetical protein
MSGDENLERRLEAWLESTAKPMPPDLLEDIVSTVPRARPLGVRAEFPSGRRWRLVIGALAAAVVLAVGIGAALRVPVGPSTGSTPAPTPSLGSAAPTASPGLGEWHRNNYNQGEERLTCHEATASWTCSYQVPDGSGSFNGQNVTDVWTCPAWFPSTICENVVAVYAGRAVYLPPEGQTSGPSDLVSQDYVITNVDGQTVLQLYWVDQFVCPWYRTFAAALAADYNCVVAP